MGEVYLAHDARLDRQIALKVISPNFAKDEARVRRFDQEARAASALNHPNVCVIHEVGTTKDGRHFMAMEFIDGVTLRRRMSQRKLTLKEVLDVAAQVAWALQAAHAAGIVHRDIKPENIMVRRDGYVKVLDFGIAKLSAHSSRLRNVHAAETTARFETSPGILVGTAKYMSPEQLREQPVDQRSDIWSLGVVLHEMVTGFTPFEAHTTNETIAVILEKQPPQLSFDSDKVPEEFQQVVRKALSKKRHERYQDVHELSSDLRKLRRQISAEALDEPLELRTLPLQATVDSRAARAVKPDERSTVVSKIKSQAIWTAEYVLSEIKQHKTAAAFTSATAVLVLLVYVPRLVDRFRRQPHPAPSAVMKMTALTNSGKTVCAAISPDGSTLAHVEDKNGMQELRTRSTVTPGAAVIVPAGKFDYKGVTFSPDGNYLYFVRGSENNGGILFQVALPGGEPRKIIDGVDSPISLSPLGDRFAFVRSNKSKEFSLVTASIDGSGEQTLLSKGEGNRLSVSGPAWSPDGKTVACAAGSWDTNGYHMNLIETGVEDKSEKVIGRNQWYSVLQVAWLEDHSGLVISAKEQALSPYQLWRISYPQGEAVRITQGMSEYKSVSLSRNGDTIVPVETHQNAQIWVGPAGDAQQSGVIVSTTGRNYGLDWTSKGKIVYSSMTGDNLNISMIDPDNSSPTRLTEKGDNYSPVVSRDGRYIVFTSNRKGSLDIWRMNADDGSEQKQLTFGGGNSYPSFSADDRWVVYDNLSNPTSTAWKVPIDGGKPIQLADACVRMPVVSPDNQFVACRSFDEAREAGIAIIPFAGDQSKTWVPITIMEWQHVEWTADGRALTYIDSANGASNIWSYDRQSGKRKQLTDFKTDKIFAYAWSPDHKQLASLRGSEIRNVMTITNWK
jgi:serine/threonine protein kinase/Tol biopolymer transport system component